VYVHLCLYNKQPQNEKNAKKQEITKNSIISKIGTVTKMGRINVDISDELEKQLRLKTVEKFGGKKGDLSKAVQEAVRTWINTKL
jgi:ribbon-helix-helix protein